MKTNKKKPSTRKPAGRDRKPARGRDKSHEEKGRGREREDRDEDEDEDKGRDSRRKNRGDDRDSKRGRGRKSKLEFEDFEVNVDMGDGLEITSVKLALLDEGSAVALASITINEGFVVSGLRLIDGKKGLFASMPQREDRSGDYHDIAFPLTKEGREAVNEAMMDAYDQAGGK